MELLTLVSPELEPIQQLAPYLNSLSSVSDAVESFNELADLLLLDTSSDSGESSPHPSSLGCSPAPSTFLDYSDYLATNSHSSSGSSPASESSSSYCDDLYSSPAASLASSRSRRGGCASRPTKNATAAERYRRKLKGRDSGLHQQLEREQERNRRLRATLLGKLEVYREFAQLLAQNTGRGDTQLASLALESLGKIININADSSSSGNDLNQQVKREDSSISGIEHELFEISKRFQQILSQTTTMESSRIEYSQYQQQHPHQVNREETQLVYDFYTDRFIDSYPSE